MNGEEEDNAPAGAVPSDSTFEMTCEKYMHVRTRKGYDAIIKSFEQFLIDYRDEGGGHYVEKEFVDIPAAVFYKFVDHRSKWQPGERHSRRGSKPDFALKGQNVAEQINSSLRKFYAGESASAEDHEHMNQISRKLQQFVTGRRNQIGDLLPEANSCARDFFLPEEYKHLIILTKRNSPDIFNQFFQVHMWNTVQRGDNICRTPVANL
jgi:hypothetical protein